jgi:hypothetical protein
MSGFDIHEQIEAAKSEDQGKAFHVRGADGKPAFHGEGPDRKPVTITVAGTHSERVRRKDREIRRRKIRQGTFTLEQAHDNAIELAVAATIGWDGFTSRGAPLPCTPANVEQLYRGCPWIFDDAQEAMNDHAGFFEKPSPEQ